MYKVRLLRKSTPSSEHLSSMLCLADLGSDRCPHLESVRGGVRPQGLGIASLHDYRFTNRNRALPLLVWREARSDLPGAQRPRSQMCSSRHNSSRQPSSHHQSGVKSNCRARGPAGMRGEAGWESTLVVPGRRVGFFSSRYRQPAPVPYSVLFFVHVSLPHPRVSFS